MAFADFRGIFLPVYTISCGFTQFLIFLKIYGDYENYHLASFK